MYQKVSYRCKNCGGENSSFNCGCDADSKIWDKGERKKFFLMKRKLRRIPDN